MSYEKSCEKCREFSIQGIERPDMIYRCAIVNTTFPICEKETLPLICKHYAEKPQPQGLFEQAVRKGLSQDLQIAPCTDSPWEEINRNHPCTIKLMRRIYLATVEQVRQNWLDNPALESKVSLAGTLNEMEQSTKEQICRKET